MEDSISDVQLDEWERIAAGENADSKERNLGSVARNRRIQSLVQEVRRERLIRDVLEKLYASEINARISWVWDTGFAWELGDDWNNFTAKGSEASLSETVMHLGQEAARKFPESQFGRWWMERLRH